ncbi:XF1762 family protein, partial [Nocardioides marmoriginsengisoli]|uniref:XF1762 family protein n=1 Tax=Nocardioides marmoriginsengisoli TaxID=661483 RepID=UPI001C830501
HGSTRGHKFSIAVGTSDGVIRGVAIAGRPVARLLDDGITLEVLRVCTDGTPNACSMLYGAVRRAGIAMGYPPRRIITYTLASESGRSLHAAGWIRDAEVKGDTWDRPNRARTDKHPVEPKIRWRAAA